MKTDRAVVDLWPLAVNQFRRVVAEERGRLSGHPLRPFNIPICFEFTGNLDVSILEEVLSGVVQRQSVFRAAFVRRKPVHPQGLLARLMRTANPPGPLRQEIFTNASLSMRRLDLSDSRGDILTNRCKVVLDEECGVSFDLAAPPLARATLVRMSEYRHRLFVVLHHIISDRWSARVLEDEVVSGYAARRWRQQAETTESEKYDYGTFARQQGEYLESAIGKGALQYWRRQWNSLADAQIHVTDLPSPTQRQRLGSCEIGRKTLSLDRAASVELRKGASRQGATVYMLALAALGVVLRRFTKKDTVGIWCNFNNRPRLQQESVIGWFVNTHLIGVEAAPRMRHNDIVSRVRDELLEGLENQEVPLAALWRTLGRSKIDGLRIALDIENRVPCERQLTDGLRVRRVTLAGLNQWLVHLQVNLNSTRAGIDLVGVYSRKLFSAPVIASLLDQFRSVLTLLATTPSRPIS